VAQDFQWLNVLVIDDSPSVASFCEQLLRMHYQLPNILQAYSALDAIKLIQNNKKINLLIVDLNMPGMDGIELITFLNKLNYKGYVVIVSGTASHIIQSVEKLALKHGLNLLGAIQKPVCREAFDNLFTKLTLKTKKNSSNVDSLKIYEIIRAVNNKEVKVFYQPLVNMDSNTIHSMEALCRINHPTKGLIQPDLFIDIAEQSELIYHLTFQVIHKALSDFSKWLKNKNTFKLSLNISPALFSNEHFYQELLSACDTHNIAYHKICIEITENILEKSDKRELEVLSRLALKGFTLSLDDFGTGHASIERLYNLPFQQIKIDKSIFLSSETNCANIIATTAAMTNKLNMTLVIEGVETYKHWGTAKHNGGDIAQGFYISKPLIAEKVEKWLENWQAHIN